jgi:hypothetical protein
VKVETRARGYEPASLDEESQEGEGDAKPCSLNRGHAVMLAQRTGRSLVAMEHWIRREIEIEPPEPDHPDAAGELLAFLAQADGVRGPAQVAASLTADVVSGVTIAFGVDAETGPEASERSRKIVLDAFDSLGISADRLRDVSGGN